MKPLNSELCRGVSDDQIVSLLVISLFRFSVFHNWLDRLYVSRNLSISSRSSNLLAYGYSYWSFMTLCISVVPIIKYLLKKNLSFLISFMSPFCLASECCFLTQFREVLSHLSSNNFSAHFCLLGALKCEY